MFNHKSFQATKFEVFSEILKKLFSLKIGEKFVLSEEINKIKLDKNLEKIKKFLIEKTSIKAVLDISQQDYSIINSNLDLKNLIDDYIVSAANKDFLVLRNATTGLGRYFYNNLFLPNNLNTGIGSTNQMNVGISGYIGYASVENIEDSSKIIETEKTDPYLYQKAKTNKFSFIERNLDKND